MSEESAWYEARMEEDIYKDFVQDQLINGKFTDEQVEDLKQRRRECVFDRDVDKETSSYNVFCVSKITGWVNVDASCVEEAEDNAEEFLSDAGDEAFYYITSMVDYVKIGETTTEDRPND